MRLTEKRAKMRHLRKTCLGPLLILIAMRSASAASFDCSKAVERIDKLICASDSVSRLDDELASTYKKALHSVESSSRAALVKEQRNWIRFTRNACGDEACLARVYSDRIKMLSRNEKYIVNDRPYQFNLNGENRNVVVQRDPNGRIDSFNSDLAARSQDRILYCTRLVDLPVGVARSNDSYGGYCVLDSAPNRRSVEVCNDDMLGHFSMKDADPQSSSDDKLIEFTNANCFGG